MERGPKAKARHVEALRGLACVLLVAYHVIGNDSEHGMHVAASSNWRMFTEIFMHVRMPLFSFISGYVFSSLIADMPALGHAWVRKLRRLGLPLIAVSTLFYFTLGSISTTPAQMPIWKIYFLPYEHFWYLQATLLIMTVALVVGFLAGAQRATAFAALLAVAIGVFMLNLTFEPDIFSLGSALYLLPYFLLGHLLKLIAVDQRFDAHPVERRLVLGLLGAAFFSFFVLDILSVDGRINMNFARQSAAGLALGFSTCLFLFLARIRSRLLEWIGFYSYSIYLFHVFATAGLRHAVTALVPGIADGALFPIALAGGLLGPILAHHIFLRSRLTALLLLGIELKRPPGRSEPTPLGVGVAPR